MPVCGSSHIRKEAEEKAHLSAGSQIGPFQNARPQSSQPTITSAVAADPTLPPSQAAKHLFPVPSAAKRGILRFKIKEQLEEGRGKHWIWDKGAVHDTNREPDDEELERVSSSIWLQVRGGRRSVEALSNGPCRLLLPLPRNPMSGVVSPPLLATTGIVPLSIFSTGPDIIGHYYDCIVAARREVILLTNYWQGGKNVDRIAEALRELNKRVESVASSVPLKPGGLVSPVRQRQLPTLQAHHKQRKPPSSKMPCSKTKVRQALQLAPNRISQTVTSKMRTSNSVHPQ